jgi:hypothetical protein
MTDAGRLDLACAPAQAPSALKTDDAQKWVLLVEDDPRRGATTRSIHRLFWVTSHAGRRRLLEGDRFGATGRLQDLFEATGLGDHLGECLERTSITPVPTSSSVGNLRSKLTHSSRAAGLAIWSFDCSSRRTTSSAPNMPSVSTVTWYFMIPPSTASCKGAAMRDASREPNCGYACRWNRRVGARP